LHAGATGPAEAPPFRLPGGNQMRPFAFLTLAAVGLAACQEPSSPSAPGDKPAAPEVSAKAPKGELIPGQYVVVFRRDVRDVKSAAKALAGKHGAKLKRTYEAALKGMAIELPDSAAAALSRDPAVELVEQNQVVHASAAPIVQLGATAGLDRIDQRLLPLSNTYSYAAAGAGVHVYILDTGINFSHTDFEGRAVLGADVSSSGSTGGVDCNGHGTHVAGTIGGRTYGVAKKVQLVAVRVLDCQGTGNLFAVLDGIEWVTNNRVLPAVANMSLGASGYSPSMDQAISNSILKGVIYAVAAGNSAADACNFSPSSTYAALTVAASDHGDRFASFSNSGPCVDLEAPGVDITSDWIGSDNATATISGTSMASPHVAGTAALYLSAGLDPDPFAVAQALTTYATGGVVTSVPAGTPNRLLYTGFLNSNNWETLAPLGEPRRELALGTWNGNIYAIGGVKPSGTVPGMAVYRPRTNEWQGVAPLPAARQAGDGAVAIGGLLYAPGGYNTAKVLTRSLYAYSPYTNTWVAKASIPVTSGCGTSQAISARLYVLTGCTGATSAASGLLHRYDPKTDTWNARKTAPHAHRYPAAGVIAGKLYVVGGYNGTGVSAMLDVYDPATNTWVTKASMPTARRGAAGATYGGKLYVIGGHNAAGNDIATVEAYNPATNTWAARASLPTARSGLGAVVVGGLISAVGGRNGTTLLGTYEVYRP
jgi:subtilisin family serine protease